jgi:hypothetical protein
LPGNDVVLGGVYHQYLAALCPIAESGCMFQRIDRVDRPFQGSPFPGREPLDEFAEYSGFACVMDDMG